MPLEATVIV